MTKLQDKTGWELMAALAELAEPIGNLANDDQLWECFKECTKEGVRLKQRDGLRFILRTYSKLLPMLCGKEHLQDTMRIIAVIEDKPISEVMQMNGVEMVKDFLAAYKGQLDHFFTIAAHSGQVE